MQHQPFGVEPVVVYFFGCKNGSCCPGGGKEWDSYLTASKSQSFCCGVTISEQQPGHMWEQNAGRRVFVVYFPYGCGLSSCGLEAMHNPSLSGDSKACRTSFVTKSERETPRVGGTLQRDLWRSADLYAYVENSPLNRIDADGHGDSYLEGQLNNTAGALTLRVE